MSHQQAMNKVQEEFKKYKNNNMSQVEKDYLKGVKGLETHVKQLKHTR